MFTWICPTCGTEVPPHLNDCPACAAAAQAKAAAAGTAPPSPASYPAVPTPQPVSMAAPPPPNIPVASVAVPPPPSASVPAAQPRKVPGTLFGSAPIGSEPLPVQTQSLVPAPPQPPSTYPPPPGGLPGWLVGLLVALGLGAVLFAGYQFLPGLRSSSEPAAAKGVPTAAETSSSQPAKSHPLAKYVEISGFRMVEENRKPAIRMAIVNHSAAELPPLTMEVNLKSSGAKPDEPPISTFTVKVPSVGPYESKDVTTPITSRLRAYEFPDWQFLRVEFTITAPQ